MCTGFRTLNYLGSKLRLLGFIEENVRAVASERSGVCDLFAGSGCVSYRLARKFQVVSCDIQHYSNVICNALLKRGDVTIDRIDTFFRAIDVAYQQRMLDLFKPLIELEENAIFQRNSATLTDIVEHGSVEVFNIEHCASPIEGFVGAVGESLRGQGIANEKTLISRYYGGVYFSYRQAVLMDVFLEHINTHVEKEERDFFLAALLSTASDVVDTVGKHFAQPIRARDSKGKIKPLVYNKAVKDKTIDIVRLYREWLVKYASLPRAPFESRVICGDYQDCLRDLPDGVGTIYADPPYTREHYSRFYHVLETMALRDSPNISMTTLHGERHVSNGIHRAERFQSPFCIRSQAPHEFEKMFELASSRGKNLLLSYSPYDRTKHSHPRVVTIEQLIEIAKRCYRSVEIVSAGAFRHNKLNSSVHKLEAEHEAELLIVSTSAR